MWPATAPAPLVVGQTFMPEADVLGETGKTYVYLPLIYPDSVKARRPVLYMPDGGLREDFLPVAGLVQLAGLRAGAWHYALIPQETHAAIHHSGGLAGISAGI